MSLFAVTSAAVSHVCRTLCVFLWQTLISCFGFLLRAEAVLQNSEFPSPPTQNL